MTDPQELTPEHVAALQKQLADAAAQVAKVQAELQTATGGAAPAAAPAGSAPSPHQPMVFIGGQRLGGGPGQVDLDAVLGPERAAQTRQAVAHLSASPQYAGFEQLAHLSALGFGGPTGAAGSTYAQPPAGPTDPASDLGSDVSNGYSDGSGGGSHSSVARLADPPRPVPSSYVWGLFGFSMWEVFGIFMGAVAPCAIWITYPPSIPAAFLVGIVTIVFIRGRKDRTELDLVRWGQVATVTNSDELSRGTYYSGTTVQNMVMAQAHGWDVTRQLYSGPVSVTKIEYQLGSYHGSFKLHGLEYEDGVILADSRHPETALCVSSFPYSVKPDADGNMTGHLSTKQWVGIGFTLAIYTALVAGFLLTGYHYWVLNGR